MQKSRNSRILDSFVDYCIAHPQLRFWQALASWAGHNGKLVFVEQDQVMDTQYISDTFYWEGRNK